MATANAAEGHVEAAIESVVHGKTRDTDDANLPKELLHEVLVNNQSAAEDANGKSIPADVVAGLETDAAQILVDEIVKVEVNNA